MQSPRFPLPAGRPKATAALLLVLLPLLAPARDAAIRLPADFAGASTRIEFEGFSGYNRGNCRGAEFRGEFTRIESRLGVFDPLYVANKAKSSFTIEDADGANRISAECRATERTATVRIVTIDLDKLTYECAFSGQDGAGARFVLGEPKREGLRERLLARERRRGEAVVLDKEIVIESVHEYEGSKLTSQAPLGYLLASDGIVIAAVDLLDWNPIVHLADALDETERRAATVVALALATLRDPANSALED